MDDLCYLYVEDDALSREAMSVIMSRVLNLKHVHIFEDSQDFIARVKALPKVPDIALLDIHMLPHDGFEMLRMLRAEAEYKDMTVIALTASVMNEEIKSLRESGFDGMIGKPISVSSFPELLERIASGESVWHITDI